ncbi:MAG: CRISPR-associated endonuclease Cas2 [Campylobacterota bacterium]|nr:CRISPR-associated endonuclease Cas2 [Campylobacterota bacterium]
MKILLTYDISDSKKRNKIANLLEAYGVRVNYSVFELDIAKRSLDGLLSKVEKLSSKEDSIRVYRFSKETIEYSYELKKRAQPFVKESGYVE